MPTLENKKNHKSMTSVSTLTKIRREKKKTQVSRRKEIIKWKLMIQNTEINDIEYRKTKEKINDTQNFLKINKIGKPLTQITGKRKIENTSSQGQE